MNKIGFIGTGDISKAIISTIYTQKLCVRVMAYDSNENNYLSLGSSGVVFCQTPRELIQKCDYIVINIDPVEYKNVLNDIKDVLTDKNIIISMTPGINLSYVKDKLGFEPKFIRVMTNSAIIISSGSTAIVKNKSVTSAEFSFVYNLFNLCGNILELQEDKIDEISPINGAPPIFIYYIAKAMINYSKDSGLKEEDVLNLFCRSAIGTAKMILNAKSNVDQLISTIDKKDNIAFEIVKVLEDENYSSIIEKSCNECYKKMKENVN